MGWAVGYDSKWKRDIGYGVPSICDFPDCEEEIDRGLGYVCGGEPYGGENGCGLFFCGRHMHASSNCFQCHKDLPPYTPTPDLLKWCVWKMVEPSWHSWRVEHGIERRN